MVISVSGKTIAFTGVLFSCAKRGVANNKKDRIVISFRVSIYNCLKNNYMQENGYSGFSPDWKKAKNEFVLVLNRMKNQIYFVKRKIQTYWQKQWFISRLRKKPVILFL